MSKNLQSERGSVLLTALIFASILAITILITFIPMTTTTLKLSQRAFLMNDAVNIAEAGLERGLWAFNQTVQGSTTAWNGWGTGAYENGKTNTFSGFTLSQGATASVKVYATHYNSSGVPPAAIPVLYAQATVQPTNGPAIVKVIKAELARRSLFGKGGVALNGFVFKGNNPMADSWNSKYLDDGSLRGTPAPYVVGSAWNVPNMRHAKVTLSSVNVDAAISGQNADIYGTVSIGAASNNGYVTVGPNGRIGPSTTPLGTIDPNSISYNFTMDVPIIGNPTGKTYNTLPAVNSTVTLPQVGDVATVEADGTSTYYYSTPSITLNGNAANSQLNIAPNSNVAIASTAKVTVGGNGNINVNSGSKFALYTAADIDISGAIVNANGSAYTDSVQIWGTNTTAGAQTIKLSGNGTLHAVAYAPNAIMEVKGGGSSGDIFGAFVGNKVTFTGNDSFHWDESLKEMTANGTFSPSKWREIVTATDRGDPAVITSPLKPAHYLDF